MSTNAPQGQAPRTEKCPQCGEPVIQSRVGDDYCENCGWPDENRPVDPESVIDDIALEVLAVVAPEGYDEEEWAQVREAVAKGIAPLQQLARSAAQVGKAEAYNAALLDFLDAEAKRRGCDLSICEVRDENERIQWAGIEWGEETSVRAAIEELRQAASSSGFGTTCKTLLPPPTTNSDSGTARKGGGS